MFFGEFIYICHFSSVLCLMMVCLILKTQLWLLWKTEKSLGSCSVCLLQLTLTWRECNHLWKLPAGRTLTSYHWHFTSVWMDSTLWAEHSNSGMCGLQAQAHLILVHLTDNAFFFVKVCDNPVLSKSIGTIFPIAFAHLCLTHCGNSPNIWDFFIIICIMVICDLWCYYRKKITARLAEGSDDG